MCNSIIIIISLWSRHITFSTFYFYFENLKKTFWKSQILIGQISKYVCWACSPVPFETSKFSATMVDNLSVFRHLRLVNFKIFSNHGGQLEVAFSHLIQVNFKIFSKHGGQFEITFSHLIQVNFKMFSNHNLWSFLAIKRQIFSQSAWELHCIFSGIRENNSCFLVLINSFISSICKQGAACQYTCYDCESIIFLYFGINIWIFGIIFAYFF